MSSSENEICLNLVSSYLLALYEKVKSKHSYKGHEEIFMGDGNIYVDGSYDSLIQSWSNFIL